MGRALAAAGISPQDVEAKTSDFITATSGCGWGTVRRLARESLWLSDLPCGSDRDSAIELLELPLELYIKLKNPELGLVTWFDFIALRLDGASLIAKGFSIDEVTSVRRALEVVGTGFADLSQHRTLGHIWFDAGVAKLLVERGISVTTPLWRATLDWVLGRLGEDLALLYQDRIFYAYWRVGYA
jgi:hypothetical protein